MHACTWLAKHRVGEEKGKQQCNGGIRKLLGELHPQAEIRLLRPLFPRRKVDIDLLLGVGIGGGVDGE